MKGGGLVDVRVLTDKSRGVPVLAEVDAGLAFVFAVHEFALQSHVHVCIEGERRGEGAGEVVDFLRGVLLTGHGQGQWRGVHWHLRPLTGLLLLEYIMVEVLHLRLLGVVNYFIG